jgi:hypothetical protein
VNYNAKFDQMVGSKRIPRRLPSLLPATTRRPVRGPRGRADPMERVFLVYWWAMIIAGLGLIAVAFLTD